MISFHFLRLVVAAAGLALAATAGAWAATPVYLDDDWSVVSNGADPDGAGPATVYWDGVSVQPPGADAASDWTSAYTLVDSGGTINVAEGLYPITALFAIAKPLTVIGPQANVDPRPSFGSARTVDGADEAVFQRQPSGRMFTIDSSNVEFNGCQFAMQTAAAADLIDSNIASSNQVFRYNIFHRANDELLQLRNVDGAIIEYNFLTNGAQDGINLSSGALNGLIQYNELSLVGGSNGAIYVYDTITGAFSLNHTIQYNVIRNAGRQGVDVGGGSADATDSDVFVLYNIVDGAGGSGIETQVDNTYIYGNDVRGANGLYGIVTFRYAGVTGCEMYYNNLHDSANAGTDSGIRFRDSCPADNNTVQFNDVFNVTQYGVSNNGIGTFTAPNNFWGAADGPNGGGVSGSGVLVNGLADLTGFSSTPIISAEVVPAAHDFGTIGAAATSDIVVTVKATSTSLVLLESPSAFDISGPNADKFQVIAQPAFINGKRYLLADGSGNYDASFTVRYNPNGDGGTHTATVSFNSSLFADPEIQVTGAAIVDVADVATAREALSSGTIQITGAVLATTDFSGLDANQFYIQDATGGLQVRDSGGLLGALVEGDGRQNLQGLVQVDGATSMTYLALSDAGIAAAPPSISPLVMSGGELFADIESELIQINNASIGSTTPGQVWAPGSYNLTQPAGLAIDTLTITPNTGISSLIYECFDVVGIAVQDAGTGEFQIQPRKTADITAQCGPTQVMDWTMHD